MKEKIQPGTLYIVATPIGHPQDITLRAIEVLKLSESVICEERKVGSSLLKRLELSKPLIELNEHNESLMIEQILVDIMNGKSMSLISDCGTPLFSDPGKLLINLMYEMNVPVVPIPGVSSLMTALSVCPFDMEKFFFAGFLPPKTEQRKRILEQYTTSKVPIILMDTPYRLSKLIGEIINAFGKKQKVFLACDLTQKSERLLLGSAQEIASQIQNQKAEFILILDSPQRRKS